MLGHKLGHKSNSQEDLLTCKASLGHRGRNKQNLSVLVEMEPQSKAGSDVIADIGKAPRLYETVHCAMKPAAR